MAALTKTKQREILAGAISHHLKGRESLWRPENRERLNTAIDECCQQIMDDSPAGRGETVAAAAAREIWENDLSGRGIGLVRREVARRLEILEPREPRS